VISCTRKARLEDRHEHYWVATSSIIRSPALDKNARADVCVVSAGIAGMTSAYLLAREGKSVVVVDKNAIAPGETAYTTAHF
jgi:ribulose 1,5-bisphosphate synthetase/thiazole synthase